MLTFSACLTVAGKEFHNRGAATEKAISPALTDLLLGTLNNRRELDRMFALPGTYGCNRLDR